MIKKLILITILINQNLFLYHKSKQLESHQQLPADQRYIALAKKVLDPETTITPLLVAEIKQAMQHDTLFELKQSIAPYWASCHGNMTDFQITQLKKQLVPLLDRFHFDLQEQNRMQAKSDLTIMNMQRLCFYRAAQKEHLLHRAMYSAILDLHLQTKCKVNLCALKNGYSPFQISKLYKKSEQIAQLKKHLPYNYRATQDFRSRKLDIKSTILYAWCKGLRYDAQSNIFTQESSIPFLPSDFQRLQNTLIDVQRN